MKMLRALHDPKNDKYATYYTIILIVVTATAILMASGILEVNFIEGPMIFFEGFLALVMLTRHQKSAKSFEEHLQKLKSKIM